MRANHLAEALARTDARVVVVQPSFQNPTTVSLSTRRGRGLREIASAHGAFLIEDDFAWFLAHAGAPIPPPSLIADDPDGVVIQLRSLTKATSPSLCVAALAARGPVLARLRSVSVIDTLPVPAPLQYAALEMITASGWRRGLSTLGRALRDRREVAINAVEQTFGAAALDAPPHGGYHLWVALLPGVESRSFAAAALARCVSLTPGADYGARTVARGYGSAMLPHPRPAMLPTPSPD